MTQPTQGNALKDKLLAASGQASEDKAPTPPVSQEMKKEEVAGPKPGDYLIVRDKKIIRADGSIMKASNSPKGAYYSPKTQEEEDLCKYFVTWAILKAVK